jgi:hypothetical protein
MNEIGKSYKVFVAERYKPLPKLWLQLMEISEPEVKIDMVHVDTLQAAKETLHNRLESFDLIVMGCCLEGQNPNTMGLVRMARERGHKRPIIAVSCVCAYLELLVDAGANHVSDKKALPAIILRLLKSQQVNT